jgi:DNA-binding cell septation regulator SpoVG
MTAPIEVLEVRRLDGDSNLKAFAKVKLGSVIIHGCRIIQQPGQRAWVALPQTPARKKQDGSGEIRDAVLEAWQRQQQRLSPGAPSARRATTSEETTK